MAFLGLGSRAKQPNVLGSIQIQTSERGVVIPWGAGTFKAPIKLLDYVDFYYVANTQNEGGKGGATVTSYEYYAAIDALLCAGPIAGIGNIYDAGGGSSLVGTTETYTIPLYGGSYTVGNASAFFYDEGVTYEASYTQFADDFGSDGPITITGTQDAPMQKVATVPTSKQYRITAPGVYEFAAADHGLVVSITYAYDQNHATDSEISPATKYALSVINGTRPQFPWSYMVSKHPERALQYNGLARVVASNFDLGTSAAPPNLTIEVLNAKGLALGGGIADCDPAAVIAALCADAIDGFNWQYLGDVTGYSNFCVANNLLISPFFDGQKKATEVIKEICDLTNAEAVWSGDALKIVPYGDTTAVANGRTYIPATKPIAEYDYSDFVSKKGEEPVKVRWRDLADNYNRLEFEYEMRDDNYNIDIIRESDEASILMNGLLPSKTITAHHFKVKEYASAAANMLLKRNAVPLREYEFSLKWWAFELEPMDIIVLNPKIAGATNRAVRVVSVEEQDDYSLKIVAEDFLFGVAQGYVYPKGTNAGNQSGAHNLPGATSLLAHYLPTQRVTGGNYQLWLALTGGDQWGGCNAWISLDGTDYSCITPGGFTGRARAGTLTAFLPAGPDPDTTDSPSITTTGTLASTTDANADAGGTLSLIGNELIAFATATLTGSTGTTNSYNLSYLRRGFFSTPIANHTPGETFIRLDESVLKYTFDASLLGKTVYFKFTSRNLYGLEEQSLADVTAYPITLNAPLGTANMTVSSSLNLDATDCTVNVYLAGGSLTDNGTASLANGAIVVVPATSYSPKDCSTWYGVNYRVSTASLVLYTDAGQWKADQSNPDYVAIGSTTTPAAHSVPTYAPTSNTTSGNFTITNPTGPYTPTSGSAELSVAAIYAHNTAVINYAGFGSVSFGTDSTIHIPWNVTVSGTSGPATEGTLSISLSTDGGATSTTLLTEKQPDGSYSGTATGTVPAGTDFSNVVLTVGVSVPSVIVASGVTLDAEISYLAITNP